MKQTGIDAIKDMMAATGIRQGQIAEISGCAAARLSGYLRGKTGPQNFKVINKIMKLVNNYRAANGIEPLTITDFHDD